MIFERPDWMYHAACRGMDVSLFMPERGDVDAVEQAIKTCNICPVRAKCLEYGRHQRYGIWGGLTGNERRKLNSRAS
jgi:WhiB family redox-sensing transcriptional regulator